jgi:hypothetical protein
MKNESDLTMKDDNYSNNTDDILDLIHNDQSGNDDNISDILSFNDLDQDSDADDTDEDLLALLEMISGQEESNNAEKVSQDNQGEIVTIDNNEESWATDLSENESSDEDIFSINDLLGEEALNFEEEVDENFDKDDDMVFALDENSDLTDELINVKGTDTSNASNVGDIFSDVLSAVDSLEDDIDEDILNLIPNISEQKSNKDMEDTKKKKGFWQKIFGKDKEVVQNDQKLNMDEKEQENNKEKSKESSKDAKTKKAEVKKNKAKKASKPVSNDEEGNTDVNKQKKSSKVKSKDSKKQPKPKKAKVKKEKIKKEKVVDEVFEIEDTKPLSRVAIVLVMTFFILIAGTVIIGTNVYSYRLGLENATFNFEIQRYNEAYNEINGLNLKKSDYEIYDKIMTVMYVQKQLNSYNNYNELEKYPEALDSLLKGLERYDKYIDVANDLGIEKDLNYVRTQIITELDKKFNISETEAKALYNTEDQTQYSINVYNTVIEKMN